jgi:hypothetical protein
MLHQTTYYHTVAPLIHYKHIFIFIANNNKVVIKIMIISRRMRKDKVGKT